MMIEKRVSKGSKPLEATAITAVPIHYTCKYKYEAS